MSDESRSSPPSMLEEIKQSKPFHSRSQEAYLALVRTADDAKRLYSRILEETGVTLQQYNVLRILRGAGEEGLPTLTVGERMVERTPGVTRIIDRMEAKGWVERKRCTSDRRRVWCMITPMALDLLSHLDAPVREADDSLFRALGKRDVDELIGHLDRIRAALREETV